MKRNHRKPQSWRANPLAVQCEAGRVTWGRIGGGVKDYQYRQCSRQGVVTIRGIFTFCKRHAALRVLEIMEREGGGPTGEGER